MELKKTGTCLVAVLVTALITVPREAVYSSPYTLSPVTDGMLTGSGAALFGLTLYTHNSIDALTDERMTALSKNDINSFDRSAADNWSPPAAAWSNRVLAPVMISPLAFLIKNETRSDFVTIGAMYAESLFLTYALNGATKNIVQRNRPFTYNPDVPGSKKRENDAVLSFYSAHTAHAFNSAVFFSTVFSAYYPENPWRLAVWGVTLSAASLTGYLRYRAGLHYPSDIIAGAAAGSLTGWLIPMLHRDDGGRISIQVIAGADNLIAVIMNF